MRKFGKRNLASRKNMLKNEPYIFIPKRVIEDKNLTDGEQKLYGILLDCVREKGGGVCSPRIDWLANQCDVSSREIRKRLKNLKDQYWLDGERTGRSCSYVIYTPNDHDDCIKNCIKVPDKKLVESTIGTTVPIR